MTVQVWNSEADIGYTQITTFFEDFSIADAFGVDAIKDIYKRAFKGWRDNCKYLTELVMVLNKKCWYWYMQGTNKGNVLSKLYSDLYYQAHHYACEHLEGEEFEYYFNMVQA